MKQHESNSARWLTRDARGKNMMKDVTACKVAVLAGGWSDEREISLSSAREVSDALREAGFDQVDLLDIASDGFLDAISHGGYDVAFVAMHGKYGEDGCIQGLLEILHMPYTFSGVLASSMSMEKDVAKVVYAREGIPIASGITIDRTWVPSEEAIGQIVDSLGLPLFVKPAGNGSSFGISRVERREDLGSAIELARKTSGRVLVEEAVDGIEITVTVLGNEDARALAIVEINTGSVFYDAKVKYEPSELHHIMPARLEPDVYQKAQELAVRAHVALGCRGCSRSDFIVTPDGTPGILETNTIPGMTSASLLPDSARHEGIAFPELCKRFVELALEGVR